MIYNIILELRINKNTTYWYSIGIYLWNKQKKFVRNKTTSKK